MCFRFVLFKFWLWFWNPHCFFHKKTSHIILLWYFEKKSFGHQMVMVTWNVSYINIYIYIWHIPRYHDHLVAKYIFFQNVTNNFIWDVFLWKNHWGFQKYSQNFKKIFKKKFLKVGKQYFCKSPYFCLKLIKSVKILFLCVYDHKWRLVNLLNFFQYNPYFLSYAHNYFLVKMDQKNLF